MRRACERGLAIFDYGRSKRGDRQLRVQEELGLRAAPLAYEYPAADGATRLPQNNPLNPKYRALIAVWRTLAAGRGQRDRPAHRAQPGIGRARPRIAGGHPTQGSNSGGRTRSNIPVSLRSTTHHDFDCRPLPRRAACPMGLATCARGGGRPRRAGPAAIYAQTAASIVSIWMRSETFAHGFVVVPDLRAGSCGASGRAGPRCRRSPWWPGLRARVALGCAVACDVGRRRRWASSSSRSPSCIQAAILDRRRLAAGARHWRSRCCSCSSPCRPASSSSRR